MARFGSTLETGGDGAPGEQEQRRTSRTGNPHASVAQTGTPGFLRQPAHLAALPPECCRQHPRCPIILCWGLSLARRTRPACLFATNPSSTPLLLVFAHALSSVGWSGSKRGRGRAPLRWGRYWCSLAIPNTLKQSENASGRAPLRKGGAWEPNAMPAWLARGAGALYKRNAELCFFAQHVY